MDEKGRNGLGGGSGTRRFSGYHFFVRAVLPVVNERCESYQNSRAVEHCPTRSPEKLPAQKAPLELHFAV